VNKPVATGVVVAVVAGLAIGSMVGEKRGEFAYKVNGIDVYKTPDGRVPSKRQVQLGLLAMKWALLERAGVVVGIEDWNGETLEFGTDVHLPRWCLDGSAFWVHWAEKEGVEGPKQADVVKTARDAWLQSGGCGL